ncbi:MAG: heavy metal translocating P-type ATPase [Magnetospirillum sp. WYHS-4]
MRVLKAAVGPLVGGEDNLSFDLLNGRMSIKADGISQDKVIAAVARTGMEADPWQATSAVDRGRDEASRRRLQAWMAAISGVAAMVGWGLETWLDSAVVPARTAEALAMAVGLWMVLPRAIRAARSFRPDMNLLMTMAVFGAVALGDWLEAAMVSALFALSLALEGWSAGRARRAIAALMDLAPPVARVKGPDGRETIVSPADVAVGAIFLVHPGERIPLDGRVVAGESMVDQAPITGESMPIFKGPGADVFAGTINADGVLEVENSKLAQETTLAGVARLVDEAQSRRSKVERWVDRFAAVYTPFVLACAVAVALIPPLAFGGAWPDWVYRALVLLVISCPCALVISTPVTVVAAMASAARAGVLVKGGEHLEAPSRIAAIAFDKTGTVTLGRPGVKRVLALDGGSEAEVLHVAAALESRSTHPLARAIVECAAAQGIRPPPADDVRAFPGKGVQGSIGVSAVWLGSPRFMAERGAETSAVREAADGLAEEGWTVVAVGDRDRVLGLMALEDPIRPEAGVALASLRQAGVSTMILLTGDHAAAADRVGAALGFDEVRAGLLPQDKSAAIDELVRRHGHVAMVGDGVNDAPAMARSSLGIAMGVAGTDAAIETSDLALMSDDLTRLAWLIQHSRRMMGLIRWNIGFALGVKALFTLLAMVDVATLWGAIVADSGVSLLVVLNGLRMLRPASASSLPDKSAILSNPEGIGYGSSAWAMARGGRP